MKRKIISLVLVFALIIPFAITSLASNGNAPLQFGEDGKFTVVHLTDSHLQFPMETFKKNYIKEMLADVQPDLVVLGGDTVTQSAAPNEYSQTPIEASIEELCTLFVESETKFTITFGNHDRQNGKSGEELLALYSLYGGEYFLGYDAVPELHGEGTHDLPVLSSDGTKVAFNFYMIDSGDSVFDENGNNLGYDSVHEDQIEWYKNRAEELKAQNDGEVVPSMVFQHIIVQEIEDYVFYRVNNSVGAIGEDFDGKHYLFTPIPKIHNVKSGYVMEKPCPGYYNYGQFDAMKEIGDVVAIFSGHDHSNTFTINIDGIDVVNTGGCKMQTTFRLYSSGVRVITIDENNPTEYSSYMYSFIDAAAKDGSKILESGEITKTDVIVTTLTEKLFALVMNMVRLFSFVC